MLRNCNSEISWRLAAPSCVWPDTAAVNCRRLAHTVPEVGLYLLETAACLAYGPDDLPRERGGLVYHLHLPLDLPWAAGGRAAFAPVAELLTMTDHLAPWGFVLHPPADRAALAAFVAAWADSGRDPASVLLENTEAASPAAVLELARNLGCGVCLDLGHMLAMGHALPVDAPGLVEATRMLHLYAPFGPDGPPPGRRHVHRSLSELSPEGRDILDWLLGALRPRTVVLEVFRPKAFVESQNALTALTETPGVGA